MHTRTLFRSHTHTHTHTHMQVTSIVVLYGPRTTALVACDDGVYEFTCGEGNKWFASREQIQIKEVCAPLSVHVHNATHAYVGGRSQSMTPVPAMSVHVHDTPHEYVDRRGIRGGEKRKNVGCPGTLWDTLLHMTHTHAHARTHTRTHARTRTHTRTHAGARTHTHTKRFLDNFQAFLNFCFGPKIDPQGVSLYEK